MRCRRRKGAHTRLLQVILAFKSTKVFIDAIVRSGSQRAVRRACSGPMRCGIARRSERPARRDCSRLPAAIDWDEARQRSETR